MVTVPGVKHRFFAVWNCLGLAKWRRRVMSFAGSMGIQRLEVNGSASFTVLFRTDNHSVEPYYRFTNGYRLDNFKAFVLVMSSFDRLSSVDGDMNRYVMGNRFRCRVYHKLHWGCPSKEMVDARIC
ncbi:hypothetical protein DPMN_074941 [Dreissena polymorpha]|uniref:Uncharacterized protein n=1 Tax=Dreissena polymorpha TaxID=45954 RepID=A0A9D4BL44_DREPO|nr:hypothetical protein DPMN_074941 [Dreissena polymorpha]